MFVPSKTKKFFLNTLLIHSFCLFCFFCFSRPASAEIIFRTGFEDNTQAELKKDPPRIDRIHGIDNSVAPPNDWDTDLQGGEKDLWFNYVDHTNGTNPEMLGSYITNDPDDENNKVFYAWANNAEKQSGGFFSRIQGEYKGFEWEEIYHKVRYKLSPALAHVNEQEDAYAWFMFPFEIYDHNSVHMGKMPGDKMFIRPFIKSSGGMHSNDVGKRYVEFGSWHTIEVYCKAGDENTGRFAYWHDGELFFDRILKTVPNEGEKIDDIAILKVYGSLPEYLHANGGHLTEVWFDDLEIWNSLPATTSLPQNQFDNRNIISFRKPSERIMNVMGITLMEQTKNIAPSSASGIKLIISRQDNGKGSPSLIIGP